MSRQISSFSIVVVLMLLAVVTAGHAGIEVGLKDYGVDLDRPDPNSLAAHPGNPDDVIKVYAGAVCDIRGYHDQWPAITDYGDAVQVTVGKPYALDTFWCNKNMPFLTMKTPSDARQTMLAVGDITIRPDGKFVARGDGFVVIYWWLADRPWCRWAYSLQVLVKHRSSNTGTPPPGNIPGQGF